MTLLARIQGKDAMRDWLLQIRHEHSQARHWCWACVAGEPLDGQSYGFSDDGEPAGTAGKPLLNLLLGSGLGEVGVIVVRYYGGIKLGTGGLVRAYGNGLSQLLKNVSTIQIVASRRFRLDSSYDDLNLCQWAMAQFACDDIEYDYGERIRLSGVCPLDRVALLGTALSNRSHGRLVIDWLEQ